MDDSRDSALGTKFALIQMRLLYISFWSIDSGLTHATIFPVLRYLIDHKLVSSITLATPESTHRTPTYKPIKGVTWLPVYTHRKGVNESGFWQIITLLKGLGLHLRKHKSSVDMLWARGSVAGGVASLLSKIFRLPFSVESFEPHGDYMVESGAWKAEGSKYRVQRQQEAREIKGATNIITVSEHFKNALQTKYGRSDRTYVIPCSLEYESFVFSEEARNTVRSRLDLPTEDAIVGIYVGKFGDIYYEEEFFDMIVQYMEQDEAYFQVLLTPQGDEARNELSARSISSDRFHIAQVPHEEVAAYLCAADIGFCPVKQSPSKLYCSPVKLGEYYAIGLPTIISKGIGNDSHMIEEHDLGAVVDFEAKGFLQALPSIQSILQTTERGKIREMTRKHRDASESFKVYDEIFNIEA